MLTGHTATLWQDGIYVWGGKEGTDNWHRSNQKSQQRRDDPYNNTMYFLDPMVCIRSRIANFERLTISSINQTLSSATVPHIPRGRAYHSASLYSRSIFITGGLSQISAMSSEEFEVDNTMVPVFDLERRNWSINATFGDVPRARCHHITVVYGDTIMLHGGYPILNNRLELTAEEMAAMNDVMYDVYELHAVTLHWRRINTTQSPSLWGHSAVLYNNDVIVFGGVDVVENAETCSLAVWNQSKARWMWVESQEMDYRCAMHVVGREGSRMFVFGGVSFQTKSKLNSLYEFNLDFGNWQELHPQGNRPLARIGHAAAIFHKTLFIIGGSLTSDNNDMSGDSFEKVLHMYDIDRNMWTSCEVTISSEIVDFNVHQKQLDMNTTQHRSISAHEKHGDSKMGPYHNEYSRSSRNDTFPRTHAIHSLTGGPTNATEKGMLSRSQANDPCKRGGDLSVHISNHQSNSMESCDESWRVIDHLKAENNKLRKQLDDSRKATNIGNPINSPYELPLGNTLSTIPGRDDSSTQKGRDLLLDIHHLSAIPRLNLNVADTPREGDARRGHMSRHAVTALVNSSLLKDQPASITIASGLNRKPEPVSVSLDPMNYLYLTPNVAAANISSGNISVQGALTYDQLLAKTGGSGPQNNNGTPESLQPLMSLLCPSNYDTAEYDCVVRTEGRFQEVTSIPLPEGHIHKLHNPPLSSVAQGKTSMLSLSHLRGSY
eukprot:Tbor_TRINITY_DN8257_c0_g1::TRINITY_DN8257_c0_g1_i1::g.15394::m.15394